jgi:hypothetical protein
MSKRVVLGVGGGLLLAAGLAIGVILGPSLQALAAGGQANAAAATTPTAGGYCQLYEQTVSKDLGVSQQQLENANKDALQKVINQMAADGKLTQAQKSQAEQELNKYASNPCAAIEAAAQAKQASKASGSQAQAISGVRTVIMSAVAGALNTSTSALQSELSAGKTVSQIITEKNASKSAVDAAYLKAVQAQLAKAVSAGSLTQSQSDMAYSFLQQAVASGHYPLLDKGGAYGAMLPSSMMAGQ